ncbi:MAG: hypothetical protein EOO41_03855 [Methanobacteriota archaeon]|nr:MAG: hypothetical protein EOO41_03855 [Euryarchaeota archaeon]
MHCLISVHSNTTRGVAAGLWPSRLRASVRRRHTAATGVGSQNTSFFPPSPHNNLLHTPHTAGQAAQNAGSSSMRRRGARTFQG